MHWVKTQARSGKQQQMMKLMNDLKKILVMGFAKIAMEFIAYNRELDKVSKNYIMSKVL